MRETIFALATGPGRSAVAIVRVSGPGARGILVRLVGHPPKARYATLCVVTAANGEAIDRALVLWFPGPASFTGEDVFELQLHGGMAIIAAVSRTLAEAGARPAEPGEFTRRAFENGRLELSQAEGVADLVDAETEAQRRQALAQLGGALARRGDRWRDVLLNALAHLEAEIDFPDEDVPPGVAEASRAPLDRLLSELEHALSDDRGERIREGLRVALIGAPNAGKSSLLNALLGRDAAIVTAAPGTTRDVIEAPLIIEGYKLVIADMAGLRTAVDAVEIEGVRRARAWAQVADLRLWLVDPHDQGADHGMASALVRAGDGVVLTKSDRSDGRTILLGPVSEFDLPTIRASTETPDGLTAVLQFIRTWVTDRMSGLEPPALSQARHRALIEAAADHLRRALSVSGGQAELMAENVRLAARSLERLSGKLDPEDVLGRVFERFCIGK